VGKHGVYGVCSSPNSRADQLQQHRKLLVLHLASGGASSHFRVAATRGYGGDAKGYRGALACVRNGQRAEATAGAWVINTSSCSPGVICHFCGATWDEAWPGLASRFPLRFLLPSGYKTASDRGSRVSDANGRG